MSRIMMSFVILSGASASQEACLLNEYGSCNMPQTDESALVQKDVRFHSKDSAALDAVSGAPIEAQKALDIVQAKFPASMQNVSKGMFDIFKYNFLFHQSPFSTKIVISKMIVEMTLPNQKTQLEAMKDKKDDAFYLMVHDAAWQQGKLDMLSKIESKYSEMQEHFREASRQLYADTKDAKVFDSREYESSFKRFFDTVTFELAGLDKELENGMETAAMYQKHADALEIQGSANDTSLYEGKSFYQESTGKAKGIREMCTQFEEVILSAANALAKRAEKVDTIGQPAEGLDDFADETNSSLPEMREALKHEKTLEEKLKEEWAKAEKLKEEKEAKAESLKETEANAEEKKPEEAKKKAPKPAKTKFVTAPPAEAPEEAEALQNDISTQVEKQEAKDCASAAILLNPLNCAVKGVRMLNKLPRPSTMVHKYRSWVGTEDKNGVAVYTSSDEKMQADHIEEEQKFSTTTTKPKDDKSAAPRLALGLSVATVTSIACLF
eukprot:gnl/TRDRNA2_/TRDRNA2_154699_c0_seq8.p1 gnl/TRDRNA2_/TRDRNA2_154699_c0~~gnl/TRDRNA2_/TRDRNA2_154699_c0_seq8.p1  ORF type:complete len:496 (-),score=156.52 gnl/TRDRNA2_/TRDRNA2_154699_c0_seq8:76-1563(-)